MPLTNSSKIGSYVRSYRSSAVGFRPSIDSREMLIIYNHWCIVYVLAMVCNNCLDITQ